MLGASHNIIKIKTVLFAILLSVVGVKALSAQEDHEHIHSAEIVLEQTFVQSVKTNSATFFVETLDNSFEFSLQINSRLLNDAFTLDDNITLYKGKLAGAENSWARFTIINGKINGAFFDGDELFLVKDYREISSMLDSNALNHQEIMLAQATNKTSVIVNVKDIESSGTCALHNDQINLEEFENENAQNTFDYNNYVNELNEMFDGQADKEIQISLFADVEYVSANDNATAEMLALLNIADGIYSEQIGVQFVLTDVTELAENGTLTSSNATSLIIAFRNTGFANPGVSHLFTGKNLDGTTVGIAYVGSLCRNSSVGVTQKFGSKTAIIFAHELGHNFGAPHDNESGSACSSTPSGFIMNPNVNSGGATFSNCSVERIMPVVAQAVGNCIADISAIAPTITSVASLEVSIDNQYLYDADGIVEADGTGPFVYSLDIAPAGMTIDGSGRISWLPTLEDAGVNTVQVRVSNEAGSDIQIFDLVIDTPVISNYINFNEVELSSFDDQDLTNSAVIGGTPFELVLTGNTWKSVLVDYDITPITVVQFDFRSDGEAEIHGIAFDNTNKLNQVNTFKVFGTQKYGTQITTYGDVGSNQTISIPIGDYLQGSFENIVFIMDNDASTPNANSIFSNVIIYEETGDGPPVKPIDPETPVLNLNDFDVTSHMPNEQDFGGNLDILDQGKEIRIDGNSWKKIIVESEAITPSTIIKFDFKVDVISEVHGLGFYQGSVIAANRTIQLTGSQDYGIQEYQYQEVGEWQSFEIPIGKYLTMSAVELVFIVDNDNEKSKVADSNFRNIQIINE